MKREIRDYLYDILHECEYLMKRSKEIGYTDFLENEDLKRAFVRSLEIIGEAARRIPSHIKKRYPDVEWKEIVGMRNKITHEYWGIDYEIVWRTVEEDIPRLKSHIEQIINNINRGSHE